MSGFEKKYAHTYVKTDVKWENLPDRAMPVMYQRWNEIDVYRFGWDFFGLFDDKVVRYGPWIEMEVDWDGLHAKPKTS